MDNFVIQAAANLNRPIPGTPAWLRNEVLNVFQYDATTPQTVALLADFSLGFPVVDASKRIVTQCAIITDINKKVNILVAKQSPPVALSGAEVTALQGFIDSINPAGIQAQVSSRNPDLLYVEADIYTSGDFVVVKQNVITVLNAFLFNIPFTGIVRMADLENAIRSAQGVNDVVLTNVKARPFGSSTTPLIVSNQVVIRQWTTVAGYIVQESNAGQTFAETLTMKIG